MSVPRRNNSQKVRQSLPGPGEPKLLRNLKLLWAQGTTEKAALHGGDPTGTFSNLPGLARR